MGLFSSTQPNPYPTETPYNEQQLACRKKISLCTSCHHHHHPNAHRNNANTHSITSISHIRPARNPQRISLTDSTFSADSLDLVSVMVWPTQEKSRSDCAELADMHITRRATSENTGKSRPKRICQSILDTKLHIYTTCIFSHICHFRPMTQPNPLKTQIFDPFPTQPNPTQHNQRVNPTHAQL